MEEYKLTLGMEPTDDYKKAKQDLIQAMRSIQKIIPSTAAKCWQRSYLEQQMLWF